MHTGLDHEALAMLDESMVRFAQTHYAFERRRAWAKGEPGFSTAAWREYANLGWLGLALPEAQGGFDGDPRPVGRLLDYVGRTLALEPVLASAVMCGRLLSHCTDAHAEASRATLAAGERIFAFAHAEATEAGQVTAQIAAGRLSGRKRLVLHGDVADTYLVTAIDADAGALTVAEVGAEDAGVVVERHRFADGRGAATVTLRDAPARVLTMDGPPTLWLDAVLDFARLAVCSEIHGAVAMLVDATLEHLRTRVQFGRPLAANQSLVHRIVEVYIQKAELRAVIDAAERAHDEGPTARRRAVSGALAHALAVARLAAHEAVQMHGGMGITSELPVSHYFKRLMVCGQLLGNRDEHLARFAAASTEGLPDER